MNLSLTVRSLFILLFLSSLTIIHAQNDSLYSKFDSYTEAPRELAYVHLNKSTFIKGEVLAFNAYILDKDSKQLSLLTTNLYCEIIDENKKVIKSKLIKVLGGIAPGEFFVDSLFTSGNYTFKAYTNWMRNFDEQNYYAQKIRIIDTDLETTIASKTITNTIDVQLLPEGGHLVSDTENSIGIVAKDSLGFGIELEGYISDGSGNQLTSFKTNALGIGKFLFTPHKNTNYTAHTTVNKKTQTFPFPPVEHTGINLILSDLGSKVAITFRTNIETLQQIKNKTYTLSFHNGKNIKTTEFSFSETTEVIKFIKYDNLSTGINIFTLFDSQNNPLLERLFFKYEGLNTIESRNVLTKTHLDSIHIKLPIKAIDTSKINNFSISVLPAETKANMQHHNIISYTYLQPYIKGSIENAAYYFVNINNKKKYELDQLLLTQGWSSYDWNNIFNYPPKALYDFEIGIKINANANKKKTGQYLVFPSKYSPSNVISLAKEETTFIRSEFFFFDDETLKIGELSRKGKVEIPGLYIQFTPSIIPNLKLKKDPLVVKEQVFMDYSQKGFQPAFDKTQILDEVLITGETKSTKLQKLKGSAPGNITIFDDAKRNQYFDFAAFVQSQGYTVQQIDGQLSILPQRSVSIQAPKTAPQIYLDDMLISDLDYFYNFRLDNVDYIFVDKTGFGMGVRGSSGVIKIYTDPLIGAYKKYGKSFRTYKIPLSFTTHKRFYTPVYESYHSNFYKEYGVIDWFPNLSTDAQGNLNFNIYNTNLKTVKLYIEGIANDTQFISEEKIIDVN
ncbi:hypothetical protein HSX10_16990 [Winogradskyella undariae]|uniref:hypothetical protein n=1 Tax=Winogradskyella undariae TaxID=1285465 RepID=UPI00156B58C7|nr:hypothetical protein [Winogradskyella undariae]NRR93272.1 hypothetical protein [Winogradskyella undariae]